MVTLLLYNTHTTYNLLLTYAGKKGENIIAIEYSEDGYNSTD
jgi:hypothetical protein